MASNAEKTEGRTLGNDFPADESRSVEHLNDMICTRKQQIHVCSEILEDLWKIQKICDRLQKPKAEGE